MFNKSERANVMVNFKYIIIYSDKGHMFCKECIIANLIQQKKDKENEIEVWERQEREKEVLKQKEDEDKFVEKVENFEKKETLPADSKINLQEQEFQVQEVVNGKKKLSQFNFRKRKRENYSYKEDAR